MPDAFSPAPSLHEAKLGIPARFDSDAFECFGTDGGGVGWGEGGDLVSF